MADCASIDWGIYGPYPAPPRFPLGKKLAPTVGKELAISFELVRNGEEKVGGLVHEGTGPAACSEAIVCVFSCQGLKSCRVESSGARLEMYSIRDGCISETSSDGVGMDGGLEAVVSDESVGDADDVGGPLWVSQLQTRILVWPPNKANSSKWLSIGSSGIALWLSGKPLPGPARTTENARRALVFRVCRITCISQINQIVSDERPGGTYRCRASLLRL